MRRLGMVLGTRRGRRALAAVVVLELVASTCTFGYRWVTASTPVSASRALEQFRRSSTAPARKTLSRPTAVTTKTSSVRGTATHAAPPRARTPAKDGGGWVYDAPEPGVYSWHTVGSEQVDNLPTRSFPPESQRIIESSGRTWSNHHIYSNEHEEWFPLSMSETGVTSSYFRMKLVIGPVTDDRTITFTPPMRFAAFPQRVGQKWKGTWTGDTSGDYTGTTFDHSTLRIGTERVEVWGVELRMHMRGEVSGDGMVRLWISPKYRCSVKEEYVLDQSDGTHRYHMDATITLLSTKPQR